MDSIIQAIILGIVQGITEWLPISSSGHLVLFQHFLGITQPIIFDIMLHIGSLIVVLVVFREDIRKLIDNLLNFRKDAWTYLLYIIIASTPIAFVGLIFNEEIKLLFTDLRIVGFSLLFTSTMLFISKYPRIKKKGTTLKSSIMMGIAQAFAILPGVSRSGLTISMGLSQGIKKREAAKFSFLIFIPAILGAIILETGNLHQITDPLPTIIGTLTAIITGFIALKLLLKIIHKGRFSIFGWYCLFLGILTIFAHYY